MRRYAIVSAAILLLVPIGCKKDASDQNLIEIAAFLEGEAVAAYKGEETVGD